MTDSPATSEEGVCYAEPFGRTLATVLKMAFVMIGALVMMLLIWVGVGTAIWPRDVPWWWHAGCGIAALGGLIGIGVAFAGDLRRRLTLTEHDLWIGGLAHGQRIEYERVRFVRLELPEKSSGKVQKLIIEPRRSKSESLWLSEEAARECFQALREFCPRAAAIDLDGQVEMPQDAEDARSVHFALSKSLRSKAWRQVGFCAFLLCIWVVMVYTTVVTASAGSGNGAHSHMLLFALPTAMIGAGASAVQNFRQSRVHAAASLLVQEKA